MCFHACTARIRSLPVTWAVIMMMLCYLKTVLLIFQNNALTGYITPFHPMGGQDMRFNLLAQLSKTTVRKCCVPSSAAQVSGSQLWALRKLLFLLFQGPSLSSDPHHSAVHWCTRPSHSQELRMVPQGNLKMKEMT